MTSRSGEIKSQNIFNRRLKKNYLSGDDYSDSPVSFDVEIITDDESVIGNADLRKIEKWLFNRAQYKKLYLDANDDCVNDTREIINGEQKGLYLNCRFINHSKIENSRGIIGFRATLEADSNMFWQDPVTYTFNIEAQSDSDVNQIDIITDTDIDDYVYPSVSITMQQGGGDVSWINYSDSESRVTTIKDIGDSANIIIDSKMNFVTDGYYDKFEGLNFPRLLDGENRVVIIGNVNTIRVEFNNRRAM